jgi:hypothetical protein
MRVATGRSVKVGPGDEVVIQAQLPKTARSSRLYVFAKGKGEQFSPYVANVGSMLVANGKPQMLSPMSLRLAERMPTKQISFVSDIDGVICVMQEVDTKDEPLAKVSIRHKLNPDLTWRQRIARVISGLFPS